MGRGREGAGRDPSGSRRLTLEVRLLTSAVASGCGRYFSDQGCGRRGKHESFSVDAEQRGGGGRRGRLMIWTGCDRLDPERADRDGSGQGRGPEQHGPGYRVWERRPSIQHWLGGEAPGIGLIVHLRGARGTRMRGGVWERSREGYEYVPGWGGCAKGRGPGRIRALWPSCSFCIRM